MKNLIANLEKVEQKIIEKCEKRDAISLKRSDDWRESPQGKIYEHKTGVLADSVDGIREAISNINAFID
jgi:hypothetical protein